MDWRRAVSVQNVAWKTGTSYGARDAWAVGVTPHYVVGVWVGNADGSGVADLTGARCAGPILFDVFGLLPYSEWFAEPQSSDGELVQVCCHSGCRRGRYCTETKEMLLPQNSIKSDVCPYCTEILVSLDGERRVSDRSEPTRAERYFSLPPHMEHYYMQLHPEYVQMPETTSLASTTAEEAIHFIYPTDGSVVAPMKQMDGTLGSIVCKVAHTSSTTELFWHLDDCYIGSTTNLHNMPIQPSVGYHTITVVDNLGNQQTICLIVK
jgi:penicillin-binding protein 1C